MSRCRKLSIVALTGCLLLSSAAGLHAQSDAETALKNAREAYQAEQFELARDQASKASQTDARNPDVWLLLGKAHFQLGELDQALATWRTLLKLAPNHAYGRRMVNALQGQASDIDLRIQLASVNVSEGFLQTARADLQLLRTRSPLSVEQRRTVLMLLAEVAVLETKGTEALAIINELTTRDADVADSVPVRILTARAQLATGGAFTSFGLAALSKIVEDSGDAPEGELAKLELLLYRLSRSDDVVAEVAAWVGENELLPVSRRARLALRDSAQQFLRASAATPPPKQDAQLNDDDKSALTAAGHAFKAFVDLPDQIALARALTAHLEKRYVGIHAFAAAQGGLAMLDQMNLPEAVREVVSASRERVNEAEATFEFVQISRDVGETVASPDVLKKWITEHAGHPKELEARRRLVFVYLNVTKRQAAPRLASELSDSDQNAIAAASELIQQLKTPKDVSKIVKVLTQHFQKHYFERGAHAAAIAGITAVLPLEVPARRAELTHVLLGMQSQAAISELQAAVAAGTIPAETAPLPASLEAAAATAVLISRDYPATPAWTAHAEIANRVLVAAGSVSWPTRVTGPKAAHGWALTLAFPVVKANADAASVKLAREVIDRVVNELAAVTQPTAAGLATISHAQLLELLPQDHDLWAHVTLRHVDLLTADASRTFDENVRSGEGVKNAKPTETHATILKLLSDVVKQRPALAATSLQKLGVHLQKWSAARHDVVVEAAYQTFAADLPPATQRQTQLALARLWFTQVLRAHNRILTNGFLVARALDARAQKALLQCYQLASSLGAGDPLLADIRALRIQIVDHYLALEYEDIAEAAIKVKAAPANADLDEEAELELAGLKRRIAERQLARQLKQHDGQKLIVLTPAFNEAIAALKKFITDHPTSERVPTAVDGVFVIGRRFEQYEVWLVAAQIYADFEQFAAEIDSLLQARPGQSTNPERAAIARASTLHTRASRALQAWNTAKPDDAPPPAELSDEFQAAQTAWQKVIADYQQRPVAQTAIARIMGIAQEYAGLNAWDVADATYAALLGLELPLRSPERLEFGRAICQLGKVLPDHARAVLAALAVTGANRGDDDKPGEGLLSNSLLGSFLMLERLDSLTRVPIVEPAPLGTADPGDDSAPDAAAAALPGASGNAAGRAEVAQEELTAILAI